MSGITGFLVAVSVVSLICFGLMTRAGRLRDRRRAWADSSVSDSGSGISSGDEGFGWSSWFGISSSSTSDGSSCASSSSAFSDSGSESSCSDGGGGSGEGGGGGSSD